MPYTSIAGLEVDNELHRFVASELLEGLDVTAERFWGILASLQAEFAPRLQTLLVRRDMLQAQLDAWYCEHAGGDLDEYEHFLEDIGYLLPPAEPQVTVTGVDTEITSQSGPQLVVPATIARYSLNAANARWGSLFDALYGTDVLPLDHELARGYDEARGAQVIVEADRLLDEFFPLAAGSHADVTEYEVAGGALHMRTTDGETGLADPTQFAGSRDGGILFARNGLHVDLVINREHPVGRTHHAGVADVLVEAAVTTIVDLEDSVACVDGEDKAEAYRTWLGLMTGRLSATFTKNGRDMTRKANPDRDYVAPDGTPFSLPGRALLLVRTVGHHMTTSAVLAGGKEVAEGVLDALVCVTAALNDLRGLGEHRNSRTGSVYVVKPKQHGPDEVALTVDLFAAIEKALGLPSTTIKIGIMDEERRTSVNLGACIDAARDRVIFINTGFLDRTGDEIHSVFRAGPVLRKGEMKSSVFLNAYEDQNVDISLAAGFPGRAQIGKGMWAKPAEMAEMVQQKIAHPLAGANCAWVPSPTAATLHALHYLRVDVRARQTELAGRRTDRRLLFVPPLLDRELTADEIDSELRLNAQSLLGYVVRWVGLGVGCSSIPDLDGVDLMEDRATLRISSQHIANWLDHGIVTKQQVMDTFAAVAAIVDKQQADVPGYPPMAEDLDHSEAFQAALELVFTGKNEPNGYTERVLTTWRQKTKAKKPH